MSSAVRTIRRKRRQSNLQTAAAVRRLSAFLDDMSTDGIATTLATFIVRGTDLIFAPAATWNNVLLVGTDTGGVPPSAWNANAFQILGTSADGTSIRIDFPVLLDLTLAWYIALPAHLTLISDLHGNSLTGFETPETDADAMPEGAVIWATARQP